VCTTSITNYLETNIKLYQTYLRLVELHRQRKVVNWIKRDVFKCLLGKDIGVSKQCVHF